MGLLWKATIHSYSKVRMWYHQDIPGPQDCQREVPSRAYNAGCHHSLLASPGCRRVEGKCLQAFLHFQAAILSTEKHLGLEKPQK